MTCVLWFHETMVASYNGTYVRVRIIMIRWVEAELHGPNEPHFSVRVDISCRSPNYVPCRAQETNQRKSPTLRLLYNSYSFLHPIGTSIAAFII